MPSSTPNTPLVESATTNTKPSPESMQEAYRLNQLKLQSPESVAREREHQAYLDRTDLSKVKIW